MSDTIVVSTTIGSHKEATELARKLLQKRLIGCAQIEGPINSLYWWKEEIEQDEEYRLVMKSRRALWEELTEVIESQHPYETPEIIGTATPLVSRGYGQWLEEELKTVSEEKKGAPIGVVNWATMSAIAVKKSFLTASAVPAAL